MARVLAKGWVPECHSPKATALWARRGAVPFDTREECIEFFGPNCNPKQTSVEYIAKDKKT